MLDLPVDDLLDGFTEPLLLCDEPTGNLSQQAGQEVMELLREVCDRDRRTVLLVTHNPRDAAESRPCPKT